MGKTSYIIQLDVETQIKVKERVITALKESGFKDNDLKIRLENAMSSRLSDLEGLIEIRDIQKKRQNKKSTEWERG